MQREMVKLLLNVNKTNTDTVKNDINDIKYQNYKKKIKIL